MKRHTQVIPDEVMRAIRYIEIATRRLLNSGMIGASRSAQKGTGFEFDSIRDYQIGDDIRFIDWKAYARTTKLLVKEYTEERSRVIMLVVDISSSQKYGSDELTKQQLAAQLASVITLVGVFGSDQVGLILYTQHLELCIPPGLGMMHAHRIMESVFLARAKSSSTAIEQVMGYVHKMCRKNSLLVLVSDFIDDTLEKVLPIVSCAYDVIAFRCQDKNEVSFPAVGFLEMQDIETGETYIFDGRTRGTDMMGDGAGCRQHLDAQFKKYGIACMTITNNKPWIGNVIRFLRRRMRY